LIKGNRFLVTGGAGLVGSHIVDQLVEEDAKEIIVLDNLSRGKIENLTSAIDRGNVKIIKGDILDLELLKNIMKGIDTVFHQAAIRITQCAEEPMLAHQVMATGTINVAKASVYAKVRKVVAASSASVYGQATDFPTKEDHHPYFNDTLYGGTKIYLENIFRSFKAMYNLDFVALRYFNVYGPRMDTEGKYTEVIIRWLDCILKGQSPLIFGDGKTSMDLVHVEDVASANLLAMKANVTDQVFNIGSQKETTLNQLLNILLEINNSNLRPIYKQERTVNSVNRRLADITKAQTMLKFNPKIELRKGLAELNTWYEKNNLINNIK